MNKEVVVAVVIGVVLGLVGALYLNKQKLFSNKSVTSVTTTKVKVVTKVKETSTITYTKFPENNEILTKNSLSIAGNSRDYNLLVASNELGINTKKLNKKGSFNFTVDLKPGKNNLLVVAHGTKKESEKLKVATVYYLKEARPQVAITSDDEEKKTATSEGALLKDKLEKKVMELRRNAKVAYTGKVKTISTKEVVIEEEGGSTKKIALEPEVTRYFEIDGEGMTNLEEGDIEKNDTITAFISDIAGEKKCYTVYREPSTVVLYGKVSNADTANYQVSIVNFDKTTYKVDVETSSVQSQYNIASHEVFKFGFSKLKIADYIYAIIYQNKGVYAFDKYVVLQFAE